MKRKLPLLLKCCLFVNLCINCLIHPELKAQTCPGLSNLTLNVVAAPAPTISAPPQLCDGANGTVSVVQTYATYNWSTGTSGQSISVIGGGIYTVTVTNTAGCSNTAMVNIGTAPEPTPNITQNTYNCNGNITLNAGAGYTNYSWSNGTSNQTATFNSAGTYSVTVTNAAGCTGSGDFDVSIPTPPVVSISGTLSLCSGQSTQLNATSGFSSYAWNAGGNSETITVNAGGTYTVTVTDNFGCTDTESAMVSGLISPVPAVAGTQICPDANTTLSVSNGPFQSYSWSSGSSGSTTTVSVGTYMVTVTAVNGCTGTTSAIVNPFPVPSPNINEGVYACNGQLLLNAGAGFSSYSWSNSGNTASTTVNSSGTYTVTVTNVQGCTGTDSYFANIPSPPVVSITGDNSFCNGTGADLSASAGLQSYLWSTGQNGPDIVVTTGGTFSVTATDAFGCTATNSFSVNQLPAPQPLVVGPASLCDGLSGTYNTSNNFPSYSWSNGQNTASITVNSGGIYTVTVTAANGCTGTDSQNLTLIPAPNPGITQAIFACDNQLTLNAGSGFNTYSWSSSGNTQNITVNASGIYTVTVTNAQGCTGTDTYLADIPPAPVVDILGNSSFCAGSSTMLSATGGFNEYIWSNNSNNPDISVSSAGDYGVTVTDGFGCTATDEFSVSALPPPVATISGPSQICATGSATFSVPGTFSAFLWSTGATSPSITVNTANTYLVTVTAANGCTGTDSQSLAIDNNLQPQITELPYACNGQITLDAGSGFASYNWSGGQNTQNITVTSDDLYTVTVSDAGGCTGTAVISTTLPAVPSVSITGLNDICQGTSTTLSATPGLSAYLWNTGQVSESIAAGTAGNYSVTATDQLGCTVTSSYQLNTLPPPTPVINGSSVVCTGSSAILALNGTFNAYNWSTGASSSSISITSGNTYTVTVTDAAGCTATDEQTVLETTALSPTLAVLPYACTGSQTIDAGPGFSSYTWSGGQNTASISVNVAGTYAVTVTDASGCTGSDTLSVSIPVMPQVSIAGQNNFCANASASLQAGSGFVTYLWSSGESTDTITTNVGGVFTVTVTDNLGCTDTESITVTAQALPQPQITGLSAICAGNSAALSLGQTFASYLWSDGSIGAGISVNNSGVYTVTVTDANGCTGTSNATLAVNQNPVPTVVEAPYACDGQISLSAGAGFSTYSWAGPNGFFNNNQQISATTSGAYTVTVTDGNGCSGTAGQSITVPVLNQVSLSGANQFQFCPGSSSTLVALNGFNSYAWSNGGTTAANTVSAAGLYTVTATDALGCTSTTTANVNLFPQPEPVIAGPLSVCPGNNATLSVGAAFSTFNWNTGDATSSITVQPPFNATVTVTDINACSGTASASVGVSNQLQPAIVSLPYACDGQITLDAGIGFPNYSWSNSAAGSNISVNQSGTYTVTVSDGNGCSGTATTQVTVPAIPMVSVSGASAICAGQSTDLTASGGFTSYSWSNGGNTSMISVNQNNTYTVTATDVNACTATASLVLGITPPLTPAIAGNTPICPGGSTVLNVTGNYAGYLWNGGAITPSVTVNQAGNYTVTVTNAAGCTGTATALAVLANLTPPQVYAQPELCVGAISVSTVLNAGDFVGFAWSTGAVTAATQGIQGGQTYTVTVTDQNGCTQTSGFSVALIPIPNPTATLLPYTCNGQITLDAGDGYSNYAWTGPGGFSSNTQQANATVPGTYTVVVSNNIACPGTATAQVMIPINPTVSISGETIICGGNSTELSSGGTFGTFLWSTNASTPSISVTQTGTYSVTVTDVNGCTASATQSVIAGEAVATTVNRSSCRPQDLGTQTLNLFTSNGCDSTVTIITTLLQAGLALDVEPSIQANLGQLVTLDVDGNFAIDSVAYQSPFPLSCSNCLDPSFTATEPGFIQVTAFNPDGCSTTEAIEILVKKNLNIYVPNVFYPGSALNGFFSVYSGPEITSVRNFNVFDRWGNALYSRQDLPTNDPAAGWDGSFRGQPMQPGVYVYYFEVLLADGSAELHRGDITLLR